MKKLLALGALLSAFSMEANAASTFFCGGGLACDWSKFDANYLPDGTRHSENLSMIGGVLSLGNWIDMNTSKWRFAGVLNVSFTGNENSTFNLGGHEVKATSNGISPELELRAGRVLSNEGSILFLSCSGKYLKSKLEAKKAAGEIEKVTSSRVCPTVGLGFVSRVNSSSKVGWGASVNYCFRGNTKGTDYELKNKDSIGLRVFFTWNSL